MVLIRGRRRPDIRFGELPDDIRPGDYWKYLNEDGTPLMLASTGDYASNLTHTMWGYMSPDGNGIGTLAKHTVRENEDGTITIAPGDGSSNSVLHQGGAQNRTWHGYVDHGIWKAL